VVHGKGPYLCQPPVHAQQPKGLFFVNFRHLRHGFLLLLRQSGLRAVWQLGASSTASSRGGLQPKLRDVERGHDVDALIGTEKGQSGP
jgi:hypothetical protein